MKEADFLADMKAEEIFAAFLNEMIVVHGCTFNEAFQIVRREIKREYDRRVYERRNALNVISG